MSNILYNKYNMIYLVKRVNFNANTLEFSKNYNVIYSIISTPIDQTR